jgi:hypothetical protein
VNIAPVRNLKLAGRSSIRIRVKKVGELYVIQSLYVLPAQAQPTGFRKDFGNGADTDTKTALDLSNTEFSLQAQAQDFS